MRSYLLTIMRHGIGSWTGLTILLLRMLLVLRWRGEGELVVGSRGRVIRSRHVGYCQLLV
jgi:hypothetical protein